MIRRDVLIDVIGSQPVAEENADPSAPTLIVFTCRSVMSGTALHDINRLDLAHPETERTRHEHVVGDLQHHMLSREHQQAGLR